MLMMSGIYLSIIWPSVNEKPSPLSLKWIFYTGLIMRLVLIPSTPIWEDDFYRYFFDGALVSEGVNPYHYAPLDAFEKAPIQGSKALGLVQVPVPPAPELLFLKDENTLDRIAYPHIKTIYPPVTQVFFALSHQLSSFSLLAWRILLLGIELISFTLLVLTLREIKKPALFVSIYWLNPLTITETLNAAHMDVLLVPFILVALFLAAKKKIVQSSLALAFAVGIKLWPILLAPLLFRPYLNRLPSLVMASLPF